MVKMGDDHSFRLCIVLCYGFIFAFNFNFNFIFLTCSMWECVFVFLLVLLFIWSILLYVYMHVRAYASSVGNNYWETVCTEIVDKNLFSSLSLPLLPSHFWICASCQESNNLKYTLISELLYGYIHKFEASLNEYFFTQILL